MRIRGWRGDDCGKNRPTTKAEKNGRGHFLAFNRRPSGASPLGDSTSYCIGVGSPPIDHHQPWRFGAFYFLSNFSATFSRVRWLSCDPRGGQCGHALGASSWERSISYTVKRVDLKTPGNGGRYRLAPNDLLDCGLPKCHPRSWRASEREESTKLSRRRIMRMNPSLAPPNSRMPRAVAPPTGFVSPRSLGDNVSQEFTASARNSRLRRSRSDARQLSKNAARPINAAKSPMTRFEVS